MYSNIKVRSEMKKEAGKDAILSSAMTAQEAAQLLRQQKKQQRLAGDGGPTIVEEDDDVLPMLPNADGSRKRSDADARLEQAREKMAPIDPSSALVLRHKQRKLDKPKPTWHAPWKLFRVISGHNGWVRCIDVDVTNEWFATGSNDRCIKIWDLASGTLKLTLTGHISSVRSINISDRHPYLFSVGEDKMVKCWDLERNQVIRHFHGHLSGIYASCLHPSIDVLFTAGRDAVIRVWDIRTRQQVMCLEGHSSAVWSLKSQRVDPQVISGAGDASVRLWDIVAGKCHSVLTHHKKGVRALALSKQDFTFCSASPDNIKKFLLPEGQFMANLSGHSTIINSLATNDDGVLVSGADNGTIKFWDYKTGYNFQSVLTQVQPGSLEAEAGIFASTFDQSGSRFITCEADKTIKFWKEDDTASPETHPIDADWDPNKKNRR